jgi:hypothetical protein
VQELTVGQFATDISKFVERTKIRPDVVLRKVALTALTRLVRTSPVDTGRFRGNWNVGINKVDLSTTEETDKSGEAVIARGSGVVTQAVFGQSIHISNNLPYAKRLENGHSLQAPPGYMVALTFQQIREFFRSKTFEG